MLRDRYVAREAGDSQGTLRTPPLILEGKQVMLNVDARGGLARVQIVGADGKPIRGFGFSDCKPITTVSVAAPVQWKRPLTSLQGKPVRLEFALKRARLFALNIR